MQLFSKLSLPHGASMEAASMMTNARPTGADKDQTGHRRASAHQRIWKQIAGAMQLWRFAGRPAVLAVGFLVLFASSTICILLAVRAQSDSELVAHTLRVQERLFSLQLLLRTTESAERGYLISDNRSHVVLYRNAAAPIVPAIADLQNLTADNPVQRRALAAVAPLIEQKIESLDRAIRLHSDGDREAALAIVNSQNGIDQMEEINSIIDGMMRQEETLLAIRLSEAAGSSRLLLVTSLVGTALLIGLAIISITAIRRTAGEALLDSEKRADDLQAAVNELDAFSYSVSHDLRAPLRAIDGFCRILLKHHSATLAREAGEYLQSVRDSAIQMGQLIDDLLAFSRLSRKPLNKTQVATAAVVAQVIQDVQKQARERRVEFCVGDLPSVLGDASLLKQVFTNLIGNAFKYTRLRADARVEVGSRDVDGERVFFIRDNGAGFDMRYADKLFGVFQRLHRADEFEGTGVGLAIVQRIIQRHGGRVWADAAIDQGATFSLTMGARS
jgi:signal transduction histidine kinase